MRFWPAAVLLMSLALLHPVPAPVSAATAPEKPEAVPADEYPFYDLVVDAKFLTSHTRLVIIERMTTTRLLPDQDDIADGDLVHRAGLFDNRLPQELIRDFVSRTNIRHD